MTSPAPVPAPLTPATASPGASPQTAAQADKASPRVLAGLWPYIRPYRKQAVAAVIALILAAGTVLALGQGLRHVIDGGFVEENSHLLDQSLLALCGFLIVLAGSTFARFYFVSWLGERVVADLQRRLFAHLLTLDVFYFEEARSGDMVARLTTDTSLLQTVIGSSLSMAARNVLLLIGGLGLLFYTSMYLTSIVLLMVPVVVLPLVVWGRRVRRLSRASQERLADIGADVEEAMAGIRTVKAFTNEDLFTARFDATVAGSFEAARRRIFTRAIMTACVIVLVFGAIAFMLWLGGHQVLAHKMSAGALSAFIFYSVLVAGATGALSEVWGDVARAAGAAERLLGLLAITPSIAPPAVPKPLPPTAPPSIAFEHVSFSYPSRPGHLTLRDITLSVRPGEQVAIVGPSGAGKSTLFQLLLRYHDVTAGTLRFAGEDVRDLDPRALRRFFGVVAQEPMIFSGTAYENIRFGRPEATVDEIRAAAKAAHALDFLETLPQGLDTPLGEKGVQLSGGQRQRIALARAILRDPKVLLLDEATSALDSESEHYVQQALASLMKGRTTLIVAHRLSTVQNANRIVVIDEGRIVGEGTHAELLAANGLYARLVHLQFGDETSSA